MPLTTTLLLSAGLLALAVLARRAGAGWSVAHGTLAGPGFPVVAGLATSLLTLWVWGGFHPEPVWHDEAAYRLQADLLARFRFATAPAPVPEAFTQAAVLVTPVTAPKMAPGHALTLVPGIWVGLPGLVPVLLAGGVAALLVVLARRIAGQAVALLALAIWTTQAGQQRWRASYLSESTTSVCWLVGWWCLLQWREDRQRRWLLLLAAVTGWGAIARPLTMLVFAIPVGIVVVHDAFRARQWRPLAQAMLLGTLILGLVPWQHHAVLGAWNRSPLALYTQQYMPFDRLGFGLDPALPTLRLTPDLDSAMVGLRQRHAEHTPAALPRVLRDRVRVLAGSTFRHWRALLIPAAIAAMFVLPPTVWLAVLTGVLLVLAHLVYAHEPGWTAYYVEMMPVVAFVLAMGLGAIWRYMNAGRPLPVLAAGGVACLLCWAGSEDLQWAARFRRIAQEPVRRLAAAVHAADADRALIFVRYGPGHDPHTSLVRNVADAAVAPFITAHELDPATNQRVMAAFPGRSVWLYTTDAGALQPWAPQ